MSTIKKIAKSLLSEGSSIFVFLSGVFFARGLGPEDFGVITFSLSFCLITGLIIDLDTSNYLSKSIAIKEDNYLIIIRNVSGLLIFLSVIYLISSFLIYFYFDININLYVFIFASIAILSFYIKKSIRGILRGSNRYGVEAISLNLERLGLMTTGLMTIILDWDVVTSIMMFCCVRVIDILILIIYVNHKVIKITPLFSYSIWREQLIILLPFTLSIGSWTIYNNVDSLMIGFMLDKYSVGQYASVYRLYEGLLVIPAVVTSVFLPILSRTYVSEKSEFINTVKSGYKILSTCTIPIVCVVWVSSRELLHIIYGSQFVESNAALVILFSAAPFMYLFWYMKSILISINQTAKLATITVMMLLLKVILSLLFIPNLGIEGASLSTVICEIIACIYTYHYINSNMNIKYNINSAVIQCITIIVFLLILSISKILFGWALYGVIPALIVSNLILSYSGFWEPNETLILKKYKLLWRL